MKKLFFSLGFFLAVFLRPAAGAETGEPALLKVHFLDVRQGDSTIIQTPGGKTILIDGGQTSTYQSPFDAGQEVVLPYLEKLGVKHIDTVVSTHPDFDHTGGLVPVLRSSLTVGEIIDCGIPHTTKAYQDFIKEAERRKIKIFVPEGGEILDWGPGVRAQILGPQGPPEKRMHLNLNNNSVVIRLEYGDVSFLLVGDCEHEQEEVIISSGAPIRSTVLKAGHHGSRTASGSAFYFLVSPETVVISAGKRNKFDHPHPEPLQLFRETGTRIHRTDYSGTIVISTDGKEYEVGYGYN